MKYTYKSKNYIPRNKSFKPYRVKAIRFIQSFRDFEKDFIKDLQSDIHTFLFTDKKSMGRIVTASNTKDTGKLNKAISDVLKENPEYALKAQELSQRKDIAKELFLTTDNDGNPSDINAKELCNIMFGDTTTINHNPETEQEYLEYLKFIYEVFDDFFLKYESLKSIAH